MTEPVRSWRSEVRVRYAETDQMGVAHHANYLVWCEVGRTDLIRALYRSYRDVEKEGIGLAVAETNVRYHAPARYEDRLIIDTTVEAVASRTVTFGYRIAHAETRQKLATASTVLICIDSAGRVTTIPSELRRALEQALTPQP